MVNKLILLISTGFGIGKIPIAPGTFGSLLGLPLLLALLLINNLTFFFLLALLFVIASVYPCDVSEKILNEKDPSQVVLDEIVAIPICYFTWVIFLSLKNNHFPTIGELFANKNALIFGGIFITFRILDGLKPFPINHLQKLPGGWGIVADDIAAALITNLIWTAILLSIGDKIE